ncbi:ABC transporter substrate-binding protein [Paenibacillus mesophilus]|uniref:ABC transporter substrate-binding protein n=1 Tax=Paenibacillus mesophilus TaxID=2582849 RepID=UPI00110E2803|nr:ABC transporter substrate-binding protein [Paenibacillus mesophilus]TMV47824.1 ABC transporter substrate-binding protein [Paenibacillus mesophilus]
MRNALLTALVFVLLSIMIGCTATNPSGKPTEQAETKDLVIVGQEIAASLDPVQPLTSSYLRNAGAAEALFKVMEDGRIEPSLAESAKEVDATTWEIKLKPNVRFWSGKAVDASAVIASLERSKAKDVQAKPFLADLTYAKVDDQTVQVKTAVNNVPVPLNLSYYQTVIHNAEAKHDAVNTMDLTGMYRVKEFIPKQKMVLERNEGYWGKKPNIRKVVYEEVTDGQARVLSALSGRGHVVLNIPVTSIAQFKDNKGVKISAAPVANTQTIYLNLKKPQLADVLVRQALSWALDRKELAVLGAEGQSIPVTTWLGSNPAFAEARNAVYAKADPAKAGQLLDEAGWAKGSDGIRYKDGKPLSLRLMTWGGDKALGEALQNQWTKIGVKAEVQHGDYSLITAAREKGEWDASIEAWSTFGGLHSLLSGQFAPKGSANFGGYDDEETVQLLAKLKDAADEAARRRLALKINERVAQQAPIIALYPRPQITAVSASLQGFEEHFRQFENTVHANLSFLPAGSK